MSGFFGSSEPARWGGFLKQAISNVETTFDSLLEQNASSTASMQNTGERSQTTSAQGIAPNACNIMQNSIKHLPARTGD